MSVAVPGAWKASEMPKENIGDFAEPWCWKLINSPLVREVAFPSRTITRNTTLHSLFNRTLATNDTLRAAQAFHLDDGRHGGRGEALLLASLGTGLDGHPGILHGGAVATLFDESLSLAALMTFEHAFMTATTELQYLAPVPTPGVLLVRSWVDKRDGRKIWVKGTMETGRGEVLARATCFFIMLKEEKL